MNPHNNVGHCKALMSGRGANECHFLHFSTFYGWILPRLIFNNQISRNIAVFHLLQKYSDLTEDESSKVLHVTLVNLGFHSGPQIFAVVFFGTTEWFSSVEISTQMWLKMTHLKPFMKHLQMPFLLLTTEWFSCTVAQIKSVMLLTLSSIWASTPMP